MPDTVHIQEVADAPPDFHARYDARAKTYCYRLVLGISPLRRNQAWEFKYPLSINRLRSATPLFVGTHDFAAFCQTKDKSGRCTIFEISLTPADDELTILVRGDRFLYKLVRRIVGALVAYGAGRITKTDIRLALAGRKHRPFPTAPAHGLWLDSVEY